MGVTPRYGRARVLAGLSLSQAAKLLGLQVPTSLALIESCEQPGAEHLERRMADLYGCSLEWLRGEHVELSPDVKKLLGRIGELSFADRDALDELLRSMGR